VEQAQHKWFGAHPGVKLWHKRVEEQIMKRRYVENAFGYRWYIFDRLDGLLPEACAWIPQSTVGSVINRAWLNIDANMPDTHVLVQGHDSLVGEFPTHRKSTCVAALKEHSRILVPYDDPLYIPVGVKTSEVSWGDCE
jgi:DNA polymerase I-like protein with 3'-5' exonuclease and polymerase domains